VLFVLGKPLRVRPEAYPRVEHLKSRKPLVRKTFCRHSFSIIWDLLNNQMLTQWYQLCRPSVYRLNVSRPNGFRPQDAEPKFAPFINWYICTVSSNVVGKWRSNSHLSEVGLSLPHFTWIWNFGRAKIWGEAWVRIHNTSFSS